MKFEEDEPGGGGTTASKGSLRQDVNVTWQSDRDVPHRDDTASWSFVIHELAPLPAAPHIAFSDDEVAAADVEFEPLPCQIAAVVGHGEDSIDILDCFVRRHTRSRNRMTALMTIRRKRTSSLCWLLFCSSALINHHCDEKDHR
jgi:hypothetical protein